MAKYTVLHVIGGGEIGGAEKHILSLLQGMDRSKFNPRLCCLFPVPFAQVARAAGIPVDVIDMRSKFNFSALKAMKNLLIANRVDIVHTHGVRANLIGRLAAQSVGIKTVVTTVHSVLEQDYPAFLPRLTNILIEKFTTKYVDHFVTVSELLKKDLVAKGISAKKVTTIYNGIDFALFDPLQVETQWREKLGIAPQVPVVGILARLHPVKGHRYFLEAAALINKENPHVHFLIVGSGLAQNEVENQIADLGLKNNVTLCGFIEDIAGIYKILDVLVISSLSEGFGLTAVEAMAMGVPVVATRVGGLPEIIQDGHTGYLVPPANAHCLAERILDIINNHQISEEIVLQAKRSAQDNFNVHVMVKATENLYLKLLAVEQAENRE